MASENQDPPVEAIEATKGDESHDSLEDGDFSKSKILQQQYEFEQLLKSQQLWSQQQAVKLEVGIKAAALQAAAQATEVRKVLPGQRNNSVVDVVKDLNSRRAFEGVQMQPLPSDFSRSKDISTSPIIRLEKDIKVEKDHPHRGRESHVSGHRRHGLSSHGSHKSSCRTRSRSRSRTRSRRRSRTRSRSRSKTRHRYSSRSRRYIGHSRRHRSRSRRHRHRRSRSRSRSRSTNRGDSSRSPPPKRHGRGHYKSRSPPHRRSQGHSTRRDRSPPSDKASSLKDAAIVVEPTLTKEAGVERSSKTEVRNETGPKVKK